MKKLINRLPENWLFKIVKQSITTTCTYYLFKLLSQLPFADDMWAMHEKVYIYTFLFMQTCIQVLFYFGLQTILEKFLADQIKRKLIALRDKKSTDELRTLSQFKEGIAKLFSIQIQLGWMNREDIENELIIDDKDKELNAIGKQIVQWIVLALHLAITFILVYKLSAWYIVPLLITVIIVLVFFMIGIFFAVENAEIIEKIRLRACKLSDNYEQQSIVSSDRMKGV